MGITTRNHTDCKGSQVPSFGWKRNGCIYSGKVTAARTMRQHTDHNSAAQPHDRLTTSREGGLKPCCLSACTRASGGVHGGAHTNACPRLLFAAQLLRGAARASHVRSPPQACPRGAGGQVREAAVHSRCGAVVTALSSLCPWGTPSVSHAWCSR